MTMIDGKVKAIRQWGDARVNLMGLDLALQAAKAKGKELRSLSFAPGEPTETEVLPENLDGAE